jgi:C-terminal processing protease CtpA/Prc
MGEARDLGYIRVRIGASPERLEALFDEALDALGGTRALILDLRDNPGPGNRATTTSILSRFVDHVSTWQLRRRGRGATLADNASQRGAASQREPVAVLGDRWTAGEGEALAAGMKSVANASIVGTATAGLRGEPVQVTLSRSGIVLRFPAERTLLPDGRPREALRPSLPVDLAAPSGGPGDPILYQALKLFDKPSP